MTWLFYLLIAVLPLDNHWLWRMEVMPQFTIMKILGVLCLCCALYKIATENVDGRLLRSPVTRWFAGFVALQAASYFVYGGALPVNGAVYSNVLSIASLFVAALVFVNSYRRLNYTIMLAIGGAAFASLYTIRGQQAGPSIPGFRPSGIFEDANYYSLVVGLWIPLALIFTLNSKTVRERAYYGFCLLVMLLGTTFAASRGGFLGLVVSLGYLFWHLRRRLRTIAIVASLSVPLMFFSPSSAIRRFQDPDYGDRKAQEARIIAWTAGWRMIQAHPLTGIGLGNFMPLVARYEASDTTVVSVAHNTWLETAAELGVPALLVHLGIMFSAYRSAGRVRKTAMAVGSRRLFDTALGIQAGLVNYCISAAFVSSWWQKVPWLLVCLAVSVHVLVRSDRRLSLLPVRLRKLRSRETPNVPPCTVVP